MTRNTHDTTRSTNSDADGGSSERYLPDVLDGSSRRDFLKAGVAVGVGGLVLGGGTPATAAKVEERCNSDYGTIDVADGFVLMDNRWGNENAHQCIWRNADGSYGYDFDASNTGGGINYPEVFIGTRPWGASTGVAGFPIQRRDVEEFVMEVDGDVDISGGEWNWAEEWWLMEQPPTQQPETHQYEVMLLLDWSDDHDHGAVQDPGAWTDRFGNTVDLWVNYESGGTDADFYIFRIQGGHDGGKIDMAEIVTYLSDTEGVRGDLWLSGIELGNEYWTGAVGETTYDTFDVTINGSTYTSGIDDGGPVPTDTPTNTATETPTDTPGDGLVINDYDGDPAWSSNTNDLGQWCGAGSFENGSGTVSDGTLVLEYANGGWYQEQLNQSITDYSTLVLRVSGANGGEENDITFEMGGVSAMLSEVTNDTITTSGGDVTIDLEAAGVDRSSASLSLRLNFWGGGNSTLTIEEVALV